MDFEQPHRDALTEVLRWRRDVRHFRPDPIDEAVIARLRAAMEMAPSVGNARPWRVIRVDDPALRGAVLANFETARDAAGASYQGEQAAAYGKLKLQGIDQAPLQLAVFCHRNPEAGHGLGRATMPVTLQQSTAMAIHTLWLAARAENLGLGMVSVLDPRAVEALLGTPPEWEFVAWLCLGTPEFTDDMPLLHRAGWQENLPTEWERR
jgi:5,6-dimethylbenzimidazole synthase